MKTMIRFLFLATIVVMINTELFAQWDSVQIPHACYSLLSGEYSYITSFAACRKTLTIGYRYGEDNTSAPSCAHISFNGGGLWTIYSSPGYRVDATAIYESNILEIRSWMGASAPNEDAMFDNHEVFYSSDSGQTWMQLIGVTANTILVHEGYCYVGGKNGATISTNNGLVWNERNNGLSKAEINCFAVIEDNSDHIVIAGTSKGVFTSTNSGMNWIQSGTDSTPIISIAAKRLTQGESLLFAVNDSFGAMKSTDQGKAWLPVTIGANRPHIYKILSNEDFVFCLSSDSISKGGGVFISKDDGTTWRAINAGIPTDRINDIAVGDSLLYAYSSYKGLWCTSLSSISSTENPKNNKALSQYSLAQNYPNPFNPTTVISYSLSPNPSPNGRGVRGEGDTESVRSPRSRGGGAGG